jgi:inward rectifier potassium channel
MVADAPKGAQDAPMDDMARPNPDEGGTAVRTRRAPLLRRVEQRPFLDLYHRTMRMPLWGVLVAMAATYVVVNLIFAGLYALDAGGITNLRRGDLLTAFFFSVQTFGTIGYGYMSPVSVYANTLVSIETLAGFVYAALAAGLVFARISRPTARVTFSRIAVVDTFEGLPTLMFRAANRRSNQILEAEVMVTLARDVTTHEGLRIRRFEELRVLRSRTPLFALTWTVMHPIDASSPFRDATRESLIQQGAELVVVLSGVDDGFAQRVHARHSYLAEEIVWGRRFADVLSIRPDGRRVVDYRRFHEVEDA